jgi:hypothetical protein
LCGYPCQVNVVAPITLRSHIIIHFTCATTFFLILAAMSYFLFTKTNPGQTPERPKRNRNLLYKICAVVMVVSMATIGAGFFVFNMSDTNVLVFWCETAALVFFGISWLTKGEALFPDAPVQKEISTHS